MSLPVPVSILDRANTRVGVADASALQGTVERAVRAERLGYHRFWVAEHHAVPGIAGSAPTVLMSALASRTRTIRIGSGGVMLPNHQPIVVAEQAMTLESLFPGRIDLGLGRSVGFTPPVRAALGQDKNAMDRFEDDLDDLVHFLAGDGAITARPSVESPPPVYVLATGEGLAIAARAGLPVVIGGPALRERTDRDSTGSGRGSGPSEIVEAYRKDFRPSRWSAHPYVMAAVTAMVADTQAAARRLLLPEAWASARSRTVGAFRALEPPSAILRATPTDRERSYLDQQLSMAIAGQPAEVADELESLINFTGADELLITGTTFDVEAQAHSDELLIDILRSSASAPTPATTAAAPVVRAVV